MNNLCRLKELILKYKWIFTGTAVVIGFIASLITLFDHYEKKEAAPSDLEQDNSSEAETPSATFYTVKLLLPARMSGAKIFVDGQPATVTDQASTVITVQVEQKTIGHQFTVRKGEAVCTQPPQLIRENNVIIHPCQ